MPPAVNAVVTQSFGRHGRRPQSHPPQQARVTQPDCYRCGGKHKPSECKFRETVCHFCKKRGISQKYVYPKTKKLLVRLTNW